MILGLGVMVFAIQTRDAGQAPPAHKIELLRFIGIGGGVTQVGESVGAVLLVGAVTFTGAVVALARGETRTYWLVFAVPLFVAALAILLVRPHFVWNT